jgi:RNA polymerase sigma factor (sigma-70 family)
MDRQKLAESCIYLAQNIAGRYAKRGYDYEECKSCAYYILAKAAKSYNPDLGFKFTTYFARSCFNSLLKEYKISSIDQRRSRLKLFVKTNSDNNSLIRRKEGEDFQIDTSVIKQHLDPNIHVFTDLVIDKQIDDEYINLSQLKEQELKVIKLRYWDDKIFKEIAKELCVSTQWVQQIHAAAIIKLRKQYKDKLNAPANS